MQSSLVSDERSLSYHIILSHYYPIRKDPLCNLISSFSHCCCCLCYCCRFFFSFSLSRCRPKKKTNKKNKTKKKREREKERKGKRKREGQTLLLHFFFPGYPRLLTYVQCGQGLNCDVHLILNSWPVHVSSSKVIVQPNKSEIREYRSVVQTL